MLGEAAQARHHAPAATRKRAAAFCDTRQHRTSLQVRLQINRFCANTSMVYSSGPCRARSPALQRRRMTPSSPALSTASSAQDRPRTASACVPRRRRGCQSASAGWASRPWPHSSRRRGSGRGRSAGGRCSSCFRSTSQTSTSRRQSSRLTASSKRRTATSSSPTAALPTPTRSGTPSTTTTRWASRIHASIHRACRLWQSCSHHPRWGLREQSYNTPSVHTLRSFTTRRGCSCSCGSSRSRRARRLGSSQSRSLTRARGSTLCPSASTCACTRGPCKSRCSGGRRPAIARGGGGASRPQQAWQDLRRLR